jgi:hypothetical protein
MKPNFQPTSCRKIKMKEKKLQKNLTQKKIKRIMTNFEIKTNERTPYIF